MESECDIEKDIIVSFREGVYIDGGYKTKPAILEICDDTKKAYLTIREGKFHQVKQMFRSVGNSVVYLERVEFGGLALDRNLKRGEWRFLTESEIEQLHNQTLNRE